MLYEDCFDNIKEIDILDQIVSNDFNRVTSTFSFVPLQEKIKQYYYTALPIQFGMSLEKVVRHMMEKRGASFLPKRIENLDFDQLFLKNNVLYLIEQKVKDDHDSSKKRGQVENYLRKKQKVAELYPEYPLKAGFWFLDDAFHKNRKYYKEQLGEELLYGAEINDFLGDDSFFDELKQVVQQFRKELILSVSYKPIDFHNYSPAKLAPLFSNEDLQDEIIETFFGKDFNINDLLAYLKTKPKTAINKELIRKLEHE